jgi:hypothetical protein
VATVIGLQPKISKPGWTDVQPRVPKQTKPKPNTNWYDDLILLYQKTRDLGLKSVSSELRNIGWEQMRGIVQGRVHKHIRERRLIGDRDLVQKLFQESFFIFVKATEIWDFTRKTKFLTFLGDILDQELMNIVRLDRYHKGRDRKIESKLRSQVVSEPMTFFNEEDHEKEQVLSEVKGLLESFSFEEPSERDVAFTFIYGRSGDWMKLQKKYGLSISKFNRLRKLVISKLKNHILTNSSDKVKALLEGILKEK